MEMIAGIDNEEVLQKLYAAIQEIIEQTWSEDYELTPEQEATLNEDIQASYQPGNLVDHEEAIQKMSKWVSK
jgi:predicted transcriptional regulator